MVKFFFLSAIMLRKVIHVNIFVFSAILLQFVEIQQFCYHGYMT